MNQIDLIKAVQSATNKQPAKKHDRKCCSSIKQQRENENIVSKNKNDDANDKNEFDSILKNNLSDKSKQKTKSKTIDKKKKKHNQEILADISAIIDSQAPNKIIKQDISIPENIIDTNKKTSQAIQEVVNKIISQESSASNINSISKVAAENQLGNVENSSRISNQKINKNGLNIENHNAENRAINNSINNEDLEAATVSATSNIEDIKVKSQPAENKLEFTKSNVPDMSKKNNNRNKSSKQSSNITSDNIIKQTQAIDKSNKTSEENLADIPAGEKIDLRKKIDSEEIEIQEWLRKPAKETAYQPKVKFNSSNENQKKSKLEKVSNSRIDNVLIKEQNESLRKQSSEISNAAEFENKTLEPKVKTISKDKTSPVEIIPAAKVKTNNVSEISFKPNETKIESIDRISVVNQIVEKINITRVANSREITVDLNPVELGTVKVQLTMEHNELTGRILVENSKTYSDLTKQTEELVAKLSDTGLTVKEIQVEMSPEEFSPEAGNQSFTPTDGNSEMQSHSNENTNDNKSNHSEGQTRNGYEETKKYSTEFEGTSSYVATDSSVDIML